MLEGSKKGRKASNDERTYGLKLASESWRLRVDVAELLRLRDGLLTSSCMPSRRLRTRPEMAKAKARSTGSLASRARSNGEGRHYENMCISIEPRRAKSEERGTTARGRVRVRTGTSWGVETEWSWPVSSLLRSFLLAKTSRRSGRASSRWSRRWSRVAQRASSTLGDTGESAAAVAACGACIEGDGEVEMRRVSRVSRVDMAGRAANGGRQRESRRGRRGRRSRVQNGLASSRFEPLASPLASRLCSLLYIAGGCWAPRPLRYGSVFGSTAAELSTLTRISHFSSEQCNAMQ